MPSPGSSPPPIPVGHLAGPRALHRALNSLLDAPFISRRMVVVMMHVAFISLSNYTAIWLRFDGEIPEVNWRPWVAAFPWIVLLRAATFIPFRLYSGLWRYTSLWDLRNIVIAVVTSSIAAFALTRVPGGAYPRSVFIIDAMLLICGLTGLRLTRRVLRELNWAQDQAKRVLVFGAGDAGEMIVRDMRVNSSYQADVVGFVDDDPLKRGMRIRGIPVLGSRQALPAIIERKKPDEILIAIPSARPEILRGIVRALEPYKVRITTLPDIHSLLKNKVQVDQIRTMELADLLSRAPVGLDETPLRRLIANKRVLVTGAGGSIGSELCRQIAALGPARLTMLDRYENGLFALQNDLIDSKRHVGQTAVIADVTDGVRMQGVFRELRPQLVFHAAAHKHVPLMEDNPCEAVKNNVIGTRVTAELAEGVGAERFIFISTDKAVNPTSVMGATKRVAELWIASRGSSSGTCFSSVRFGNVLGSNGSVVPRFMDQIRRGGPVTVTHPEIRRYFMLIPEAVQIVLHAAALASAGSTFVLEMGEQIRMVDIARDLIRLSGFIPEEEISISFIGLRPGEKLMEELVGEDEIAEPSAMDRILQVKSRHAPMDAATVDPMVEWLEATALGGDGEAVRAVLNTLVPSFQPQPGYSSADVSSAV